MEVHDIARVCHEANRGYALAVGESPAHIYPSWDQAPPEIRRSAIVGVEHALAGATPAELHQSWCDTKYADGWCFGEDKNVVAKTHPCLIPYAKLPDEQRRKDALFHAIVGALR